MAWHEKDHFTSVRPFSDRCASWFAWTTPNMITLASLVLVAPMCWAFLTGRVLLGAACFTLSAIGDFLDGALARYQHDRMSDDDRAREKEKFFLFQRGQSEGGLNLDPLTDKARYYCALVPLGWSTLWHPLIAASLAFAAGLTFGRPVIKWLKKRRAGAQAATVGKANKFGKFKAHAEIVLIAFLVFSTLGAPARWTAMVLGQAAIAPIVVCLATKKRIGLWLGIALACLVTRDLLTLTGWTCTMMTTLVAATALGSLSFSGQVYTAWKQMRQRKKP